MAYQNHIKLIPNAYQNDGGREKSSFPIVFAMMRLFTTGYTPDHAESPKSGIFGTQGTMSMVLLSQVAPFGLFVLTVFSFCKGRGHPGN